MKSLKYTDKILLIITVFLFLIGLIMIYSSSSISSFMRYDNSSSYYLMRQLLMIGLGLFGFICIINIPTKAYSRGSWYALILFLILLILVLLKGTIINGAKSWIDLGFFSFQPSEFVKVILIVWYAAYFDSRRHDNDRLSTNVFAIVVSVVLAGLVVLQKDFGTALIIMAISFMLYFIIPVKANIKFKVITVSLFVIVFLGMCYYIFDTSSFKEKTSRFDLSCPCCSEKFEAEGNQVCNSYIAFNNGNLWGKGLGNSTQKYLYLPESHTDFIFAIVVEELGFVKASGIILLLFIVLLRIIYIGKNSTSNKGALICYGIAIYIFLHTAINLLGIMGLMPLTGVPLPFLSYGGSFTLSLILALSIVQRVAIETRLKKLGKI